MHTYVDTYVRIYIHGEDREVRKGGTENNQQDGIQRKTFLYVFPKP